VLSKKSEEDLTCPDIKKNWTITIVNHQNNLFFMITNPNKKRVLLFASEVFIGILSIY
jgi:hypothetical protein